MITSEKAMIKAVTVIEANAHRAGWDNVPACVYALYGAGTGLRSSMPMPTGGDRAPGATLASLAVQMWHDPSGMPTPLPQFCGWAFCCEAWMATAETMTPEEMEAHDRGEGPALADRIGSVEIRMALGTDTSGRLVVISRQRGQAPILKLGHDDPGDSIEWAGRIPLAMRLLTLGVCRALPLDGHEFGADLGKLGDELCEQIERGDTGISDRLHR